jgi:hypothetical protein
LYVVEVDGGGGVGGAGGAGAGAVAGHMSQQYLHSMMVAQHQYSSQNIPISSKGSHDLCHTNIEWERA